ncbi:cell wall hydrolase [Histidinibacterium aquaticum]|uniref:cell wall hydrolase n=1 Tax=Histidinibacterium aquaticum TaxID=2613962 RepID=UPI00295EC7D9|nr:cell wall hydrolase [Histidinibacterium aquaticum]
MVPSRRMEVLLAPPAPETRAGGTAPDTVTYSEASIDALPVTTGDAQWRCLSEALYFEARGEDLEGLFAVGEVILNRVDDPRYPGTICSVVNQGTGRQWECQFTYTCDGRPENVAERGAWSRVGKIAKLLIDGAPRRLTDGATHYHTRAVNPGWARQFPRTASIGVHHFYRWPLRTASN